jgi:hypothetical protein
MMNERLLMQESLSYEFLLEEHVPSEYHLRRIERFATVPSCVSVWQAPSIQPGGDGILKYERNKEDPSSSLRLSSRSG